MWEGKADDDRGGIERDRIRLILSNYFICMHETLELKN